MRKAVNLGVLETTVGYHMYRAVMTLAEYRRAGRHKGLRQWTFGILAVVAANPGINQTSIGNALGIERANMVPLIDELVETGLLKRGTTLKDRRSRALKLTPSGQKKLAAILTDIRKIEAAILSSLSEGERRILIEILPRIQSARRA